MSVEPIQLTVKYKSPNRKRRRLMPDFGVQCGEPSISMGVGAGSAASGGLASGSGLGRSAKARGKQPEAADRAERLRPKTFKTGAVRGKLSPLQLPTAGAQTLRTPHYHFHVGSIQMNVPQDPEVLAREAKRKADEAKVKADEALADKATGARWLWLRTRRFARRWASVLVVPLLYLLDHLGLGLNLNNLFATLHGLARGR